MLPMFRIALLLALWAPVALAAADGFFIEGAEYEDLPHAVPTDVPEGKVEVLELFWYGCPHCNAFEPYLEKWLEEKPDYVEFVRQPSTLNPGWLVHARTYYALDLLGEADRLHPLIFKAMHEQGRKLRDTRSMARFLAQQGVDEQRFMDAYSSMEVQLRINQAKERERAYGIKGVPAVIVNGKYRTGASKAGGYDKLIEVINFLSEKEEKGS